VGQFREKVRRREGKRFVAFEVDHRRTRVGDRGIIGFRAVRNFLRNFDHSGEIRGRPSPIVSESATLESVGRPGRREGALVIQPALPRTVMPAVPRPRLSRRVIDAFLTWVNFVPFLALHLAVLLVFFVPATWEAVVLAVGLFWLRTWGLTAGFHRYFAHRGYKTSRAFQFVIAWVGSMAVQK